MRGCGERGLGGGIQRRLQLWEPLRWVSGIWGTNKVNWRSVGTRRMRVRGNGWFVKSDRSVKHTYTVVKTDNGSAQLALSSWHQEHGADHNCPADKPCHLSSLREFFESPCSCIPRCHALALRAIVFFGTPPAPAPAPS